MTLNKPTIDEFVIKTMTEYKLGDPCFCYDKNITKKAGEKNYRNFSLTRILVDDTWIKALQIDMSETGRFYLTKLEAKELFNKWIEGKL